MLKFRVKMESVMTPTPMYKRNKKNSFNEASSLKTYEIGVKYDDIALLSDNIKECDVDISKLKKDDIVIRDFESGNVANNKFIAYKVVEPFNGRYIILTDYKNKYRIMDNDNIKYTFHQMNKSSCSNK